MDALRARRFQRYFTALDSNEDGRLSRSDFELAGLRYAEKLGYAAGSAEQRRLSDMSVALWTDMVSPMDTDGDGEVTYEEFWAAIEQNLGSDRADYAKVRPVIEIYFTMADSDSDGEISREEFTTMFTTAVRVPEADVAANFSAITAEHAEVLTLARFHEAMAEFCYGTDPQAPANHLFGRL
ncbi:EF-hand domain-containing protein [Actinomadura sp. 3N508]|uniref:EF-hand domain-containing protein n=1 Tax=Actinomadura sp. 3N508 TaxID=3375153 RepID=UPI00379A2F7D